MPRRAETSARVLDAAVLAASEALTLADLNASAIPLLERALGTHLTAVVEFDREGRPSFKAGDVGRCAPQVYFEHYYRADPFTVAGRRVNRRILVSDRDLDRRAFESSEAFNEYYDPRGIGRVLGCRLTTATYHEPGSVIVGFFRAKSQREFSPREHRILARALPALIAAARRSQRLEPRLRVAEALGKALARAEEGGRVALDAAGRVLWMSPLAETILGRARSLPQPLVDAVRRLAAFATSGRGGEALSFAVPLTLAGERARAIELHLERLESGEPFVVGEIVDGDEGEEFARAFSLTRGEMSVLDELSKGRSNTEIQGLLHVSMATVKTHVYRILQKLGVSSRLQAALLRQEHRARSPRPKNHP